MTDAPHNLKKGHIYHVITRSGSFRGKYLGDNIYGEHQFDLRPEHGTTTVKDTDIIEYREWER